MNQRELFELRNTFHLHMPPLWRGGITVSLLLGLGAVLGGMLTGEEKRTWGSLLFNLMFFYSLALGGVAFACMQDLIGAVWGRPIKRLHEAFYAFIPWSTAALCVFLAALKWEWMEAHTVYSWMADPHLVDHFAGKNVWLQKNFMLSRDLFSLLAIGLLCRWYIGLGIKRDMALVRGEKELAFKLGIKVKDVQRFWAAPVLIAFALCFSVLTFDLTMSLAPTWFSTLWAGWSFGLMMHILMAFLLLWMFTLKSTPLAPFLGRQQFHDIGKLLHGFTVFFAYLTFAHVLTYWYTNIPEETSYFLTRLEKPWVYFIIAAPFLVFLIPFIFLIPKANKWNPKTAIPIALVVLSAQWLNYMLVVIPEVVSAHEWQFPWIELGTFLGCLAGFLLSIYRFAQKIPMVSLADPLLLPALESAHP